MNVCLTLGPKLFISDSEVWQIVHKTENNSLKRITTRIPSFLCAEHDEYIFDFMYFRG